ncbi:MAG: DMT family transporter [Gammaproteobacteria bacterium]|nr:MAG: DMT family transporter [Gammaproteobacteria bacterium]
MLQKNNYFTGVVFCLLATLSWGSMFPIMTHALQKIDPFTFTAMRYSIAGVVFVAFLYFKEGLPSFKIDGDKFLLWLFGSAGFAGFGFFVFLGQKLAGPEGALSASMMMATMPLLGLLVNWVLKGVRPPNFSFVFIGLSFLGVILVITKGTPLLIFTSTQNYVANIFMILGALCWVIYTIGATYFSKWSPIKYTTMSILFGLPTIFSITTGLIVTHIITLPSTNTLISISPELIYMALIAGFVGVLCWNQGNRIITPLNGVLFMDVVPITAFIISTMEGVVPVGGQILGIMFTVTALILNNLYQRHKMIKIQQASIAVPKSTP